MLSRLFLTLAFGLWCAGIHAARGAEVYVVGIDSTQKKVLARAEHYLDEGYTDDASTVLTELFSELRAAKQHTTPFGLWVRLRRAHSWERSERFIPAVEELLQVLVESERQKLYDLRSRAFLQLALIQEEQGRPNRCRYYLNRAREVIEKHELVDLLAVYHIRMASYQRIFGDHGKAMHHAREALQVARRTDRPKEQAWAHLLLSMGYRDENPDLSVAHLKQVIALQPRLSGHTLSLICALHLTELHLRMDNVETALRYSDSTLYYINMIGDRQSEADAYIPQAYGIRADIYRQLEQPDSIVYYLDLNRTGVIRRMQESSADRIANIEDRFESEQKQQRILEQAEELRNRQKQQRMSNIFAGTVVLALLVLGAYYLKLRAANQRLAIQSLEIKDKNQRLNESLDEQQLLRGELHHRIKNNLQVIIGLLDLQSESPQGPEERGRFDSLANRVHSMAAVHDILYSEGNLSTLPVDRYVDRLCAHFIRFSGHEGNCDCVLDIPAWTFTPVTLIPLGTMINELMMNSCKYAPLTEERMRINISLERHGTGYLLTYRDNGPGFPSVTEDLGGNGLGLRLLRGIARQLNGRVEMANERGAVTRIYFDAEPVHSTVIGETETPRTRTAAESLTVEP